MWEQEDGENNNELEKKWKSLCCSGEVDFGCVMLNEMLAGKLDRGVKQYSEKYMYGDIRILHILVLCFLVANEYVPYI